MLASPSSDFALTRFARGLLLAAGICGAAATAAPIAPSAALPPKAPGAAPTSAALHFDLTAAHDAQRVLRNPDKGWYHHFPDNHPDKYRIARDADLLDFPGLDHVYVRLAWSYFEPRPGEYDWSWLERPVAHWTPHGLGLAVRISCKETSTDRPEQQFATPRWVKDAGAQGGYFRAGQEAGPDAPWEPVWDDPVFLAQLDRFLAAFAARYDGAPWLRYLDIGSIGDWGEGHTWAGSRRVLSAATRRAHVDLHLKHFHRTRLVISDDFVYALATLAEREELHRYLLDHGVTYRDDSILVDGYLKSTSDRHTVRSPEWFADAYLRTPTVFELEHYRIVKEKGNWNARPGSSLAKYGAGQTGADYFRGALQRLHATYLGYHGDACDWLADNPQLTGELLNRCGYWLFPLAVDLPARWVAGQPAPLVLTLENRGVAPPYVPYTLRAKLVAADGPPHRAAHPIYRPLAQANRAWLPGAPFAVRASWPLPATLTPGRYTLALGLFAAQPDGRERPVDFALRADRRDADGYYRIGDVTISAP